MLCFLAFILILGIFNTRPGIQIQSRCNMNNIQLEIWGRAQAEAAVCLTMETTHAFETLLLTTTPGECGRISLH